MNEQFILSVLIGREYNGKTLLPSGKLVLPHIYYLSDFVESDLIVVTAAGLIHEYEIKTSIFDLNREYKKRRWKSPFMETPSTYTFAVPSEMAQAAMECARPEHGVLIVQQSGRIDIIKRPKRNHLISKPSAETRLKMVQRCYHRYLRQLAGDFWPGK